MAETAAVRALRLLDLVPFIVRNQGISISKLAEAFHVSREEIIKDLNLLFLCGLPGYTPLELIDISFDDDYVVVKDPQNLAQPRNLSEAEALIVRIALAAMENLIAADSPKRKAVSDLRERLNNLFSNQIPKDAIFVDISKANLHLQILEKSIAENQVVEIEYLNITKDQRSTRIVLPLSIAKEGDKATLSAFCKKSGAVRKFQLANMLSIKESNETITFDTKETVESASGEVDLRIDTEDSWFLANYSDDLKWMENGKGLEKIYRIEVFQPQWLVRSVLSNSELTVLTPESLRSTVLATAKEALTRYTS